MSYAYFNSKTKYVGGRGPRYRAFPTPPPQCRCGQEVKKPGLVVGASCWAAAPGNLRREIYSRDLEVARVAARSLLDFAISRNPSTAAKP